MASEGLNRGVSLQDIIKRRQRADFVGRDSRLTEFGANLRVPPGDLDRKFLFNIHGVAGVGKTFLTEQFRRVAEQAGVVCAYTDESSFDVVETMSAFAADLAGQDRALTGFDKRLAIYRERRHELEADPGAPGGGFIARSAVRVGLAAAREVPLLGLAADTVDAAAAAEQVDRLRAYLSKKFRSSEDVGLLLSPAEVLTKVFLADLDKLTERHPVTLFFDTFEQTGSYLESWLLDVLAGRHGSVRANVLLTIAGQGPLDANRWAPYRGVAADVPLEPFTEAEARELLTAKGVHDEETVQSILALSGRLPIWLATLADHRPATRAGVADSSDDAVRRFLKWEPDESRREVAQSGALPRRLNADTLEVVGCSRDLFDWLRRLPFVTEAAGYWRYHDVARAPMLRLYRSRSPQRWRDQHRRLWEYYEAERSALALTDFAGWVDATWQEYRLEECYHRLCANPTTELPAALGSAVDALSAGTTVARRWATTMVAAGRDAGAEPVRQWGQRLADTVVDDTSDGIELLTVLIDEGQLAPAALKEAHRMRGRTHRDAGRYPVALVDFDAAIRMDPDFASALSGRGETYRLMSRNEEALADFDTSIGLDPHDSWTRTNRGETYSVVGRTEEALAEFAAAIDASPTDLWGSNLRGVLYARTGRYDDALAEFDRISQLPMNKAIALTLRGDVFNAMGQLDDALAEYTRAIEAEPEYSLAYAQRGDTYRTLQRHEEAITDLTRAIELGPRLAWPILIRGECWLAIDRPEAAIADFTVGIDLGIELAWVFASRADAYLATDRPAEAIVDFTRAIEIEPDHEGAITSRAVAHHVTDAYDEAIADFTRAIEQQPDETWLYTARAAVHLAKGTHAAAALDLTRARALAPDLSWPAFLLGATRTAQGLPEDATELWRTARDLIDREIEEEPAEPSYRFNRALYLAALGEAVEASDAFRATVDELSPTRLAVNQAVNDLRALAAIDNLPDEVRNLVLALAEWLGDSVVAGEAQVDPSV